MGSDNSTGGPSERDQVWCYCGEEDGRRGWRIEICEELAELETFEMNLARDKNGIWFVGNQRYLLTDKNFKQGKKIGFYKI